MAKEREACGRCSTSVALEAATETEGQREGDKRPDRDPFGEERIAVEERRLRTLSPDGWIAGVSSRVDAAVQRLTWGK